MIPTFLQYLSARPRMSIRTAVRRYPRFRARCIRRLRGGIS